MKASESAIRTSFSLIKKNLSDCGLLYSWNDSVVERLSRREKRITWATSGTRPDISSASISTISEYLMFLDGNHYQFRLNDGSLIQLSYDIDGRGYVKQSRLVWYPCPVQFSLEELEYASITELVLHAPNETIVCRAPLRFDFSPDQAKSNHSSSHMHLGMEEFRLPVHRALEPSRFIRLIIRTMYPKIWEEFPVFKFTEDWSTQDRLGSDDRAFGFLGWHPSTEAVS
jgi:hypothetical protein